MSSPFFLLLVQWVLELDREFENGQAGIQREDHRDRQDQEDDRNHGADFAPATRSISRAG